MLTTLSYMIIFFFQAEDGIRDADVTGVQTCALPILWYRLAAGAPFQEGDLIDAGERTQVQVELPNGGTVNVVGPASLYAASASFRNDKQDAPVEFALDKGWMKLVSPPG